MTENKEPEVLKLNLSMFSKFGMVGGLLAGIGVIVFSLGAIVFNIWMIANYFSTNTSNWPALSAFILAILASVFLLFIGGMILIWSKNEKIPTNLNIVSLMVFLFFLFLGIASVVIQYSSNYIVFNIAPAVEIIIGAVILMIGGIIYGLKSLVSKLTGTIVATIGFIVLFIGYLYSPALPAIYSAFFTSSQLTFFDFALFPAYLFSFFGFFGSYDILALVAFLVGVVALIMMLFTKTRKTLIAEIFGGVALMIFALGMILTGAFVLSSSFFTNFNFINSFAGSAYSYVYIEQAAQAILLTAGVLFLVSGIFLIVFGLIRILSHAGEIGKAMSA